MKSRDLTLPPMIHPIIVGCIRGNWIFQTNHVGTQGLPLGEIGIGRLVCARSRCTSSKMMSYSSFFLYSCNAHFGITYRYQTNLKMKQHHINPRWWQHHSCISFYSLQIYLLFQAQKPSGGPRSSCTNYVGQDWQLK